MRVFYIRKRKLYISAVLILAVTLITAVAFTAGGVNIMRSTEAKDGIKVPVIMYHSVLKDKNKTGKFIITPNKLESDFLYLKENGYTTVFVSDLAEYVESGKSLPEKPVVITFDDGYLNNLTYALPLLIKYDMKAVISVVGSYTENYSIIKDSNPNYAYLTWSDINTLIASGRIEIGNHTYNMHSTDIRLGCAKLKKESDVEYKASLSKDIIMLQDMLKEKSNVIPITFTYPFGYISNQSIPIISELGFKTSLSCYEKINYLTREKDCLYNLGRFNRSGCLSTAKFMRKIAG